MSLILVTKEQADEHSLMHYRTKGSKNGQRLYQYEDGSLTPLGRIHYGIGQVRDKKKADDKKTTSDTTSADKRAEEKYGKEFDEGVKAGKYDNDSELRELYIMEQQEAAREKADKKSNLIDRVNERIEKKAEANRPETRKEERQSEKELEKKITSGIENFNKKAEEKAEERSADTKSFQDVMKSIRGMSDEELNKNIDRLQREKRYSELLQDQRAREKGPLYTMVSKALKNAADDLTKKSLSMAVDKLISKAKGEKKGFTLNDYKDVDLYSLDSDKLNAVSQAFNNAANIALNKWKIDHPGQDPNQQNQKGNGGNDNQGGKNTPKNENQGGQNKPKNDTQPNSQNQNGGQGVALSKNQRRKIRSMAASGKSAAEIAQQMGVSESTVYNLINS